jgi:uncharacterized membrane protein
MTETIQQMMAEGFTLVPVQLGIVTETYAEVIEGLKTGDVVSVASSSSTSSNETGIPGPGIGFMGGGRP